MHERPPQRVFFCYNSVREADIGLSARSESEPHGQIIPVGRASVFFCTGTIEVTLILPAMPPHTRGDFDCSEAATIISRMSVDGSNLSLNCFHGHRSIHQQEWQSA